MDNEKRDETLAEKRVGNEFLYCLVNVKVPFRPEVMIWHEINTHFLARDL